MDIIGKDGLCWTERTVAAPRPEPLSLHFLIRLLSVRLTRQRNEKVSPQTVPVFLH
jgi:hypothetical protein